MTRLWWQSDRTGKLEELAVTRESAARVYFASPRDGRERFVLRARLEGRGWGRGWIFVSGLGSIYTEEARTAFLTLARGFGGEPALAALGLSAEATVDDVKRAFRERAKTAHPDQGGSDSAFIALKANYERALAAVGR